MPRQQLPLQIKKITLKNGKVRYHVKENGRVDPITKQRPKLDKRFDTAQEARDALRDFQYQAARGTYVMRSTLTVEQACANWLAGRHGLRKSAKAAYRNGLQPLRDRGGDMPIQALEKRHLDELVTDLMAGGVVPVHVKEGRGVRGRYRRPWKAATINPMLNYLESMLNELLKQGKVNYNVAALVDRLPVSKVPMQTFTTVEVEKLLDTFAEDRLGHVWHLALVGLRRGELCGLRWTDIDFEAQTISIEITRVVVDGEVVEGDTKSETSTRVLPLTLELLAALRAATRMQAEEQLAAGPTYERSGYVVVDRLGRCYHPDTVSDYWAAACAKAGVKRIRLHDARHTCGTLMHLEHNVPVAIISAWLGHADTAFTMRTYVHNQPDKLALAAESISLWTRRRKSAQ
ncbi:MAG TPA: site-specific integrase [Mycobacterium sp.]|nr:site-specific integrase [Mycobacterium sp.]